MNNNTGPFTIALAGQPNVGKSTVFNMLTGLNQRVGNWPGKTVEQKTGTFTHNGQAFRLVDLPGTYSLTANSEEERIARNFLLLERPDLVIAIVNAATLEHNLYLITELLNMPVKVIVGVNMMDVAEQIGIHVEAHVMQAALGIPVVPLVATRNQGIRELIEAALQYIQHPEDFQPIRPDLDADHQPILDELHSLLLGNKLPFPENWMAIKLLEGDAEITTLVRQTLPEIWEAINALLMQHEDAYLDIASKRYEWIERMVRAAIIKPKRGAISLTDRLDKVATHPFWGLILFVLIFGLIFWFTYAAAIPVVNWLDTQVISALSETTRQILDSAPNWLTSLLVDGLIAGAGAVLTLIPVLIIFFGVLGLLEDIGYLTRSAYVMDRFMHWIGLHGRSFLPLFIGFGCNVPGILGARIIDERRARFLTILLTPLVPCTGRMAVIAFLAPAFFGKNAGIATAGLVAGNIFLLFLVGIIINRGVLKEPSSAFIMEMPLYHIPNPRTIGLYIWLNIWAFTRKAGTIILVASAFIWVLAYLPKGDIQASLLASFGHWLEPVGRWFGLGDWRLIVSLLSSFVAKENTIATLGILFGNGANTNLIGQVAQTLTPAAALAFLVVQMTFIPCVATAAAIRQETGEWKMTFASIGMQLVLSLGSAAVLYNIASGLGWGS